MMAGMVMAGVLTATSDDAAGDVTDEAEEHAVAEEKTEEKPEAEEKTEHSVPAEEETKEATPEEKTEEAMPAEEKIKESSPVVEGRQEWIPRDELPEYPTPAEEKTEEAMPAEEETKEATPPEAANNKTTAADGMAARATMTVDVILEKIGGVFLYFLFSTLTVLATFARAVGIVNGSVLDVTLEEVRVAFEYISLMRARILLGFVMGGVVGISGAYLLHKAIKHCIRRRLSSDGDQRRGVDPTPVGPGLDMIVVWTIYLL
jgi:hypothetical protein